MTGAILKVGQKLIDRYSVMAFHAQGSMQEVYVCRDEVLDRFVVVKTPKKGIAERRFKRGAEMGARVNHPNVATTFDYYEDNSLTFLVEEFVDGRDLGGRLEDEFHYLDPSLAAHTIHHIARALREAHRAGICHRDLKPSNIMTSNDQGLSIVKLTDFGIAKLAESEIALEMEKFEQEPATLTTSSTLLGAVPYLAPECWDDWKAAGQAMDVWSLGCIAYQLLVGDPPFGTGKKAIGNVIRAGQVGQVHLQAPKWFGRHPATKRLETELWEIINKCLVVNPSARPSAEEIDGLCELLCYTVAPRRLGVIASYGIKYRSGFAGKSGNIRDEENGRLWFFHLSEFFGGEPPRSGQRVNFSVFPGKPNPRCSPVLLLRSP